MKISSPTVSPKLLHSIHKKDFIAIVGFLIVLTIILGFSLLSNQTAQINLVTESSSAEVHNELINSIGSLSLDDSTTQINFVSGTPARAKLEYGYSPNELYLSQLNDTYQTQGSFAVSHSPQAKRIFFRLTLTDERGVSQQSDPLSVINSWL